MNANASEPAVLRRRIRLVIGLFVIALVASGLTAFPLRSEVRLLSAWFGEGTPVGAALPGVAHWIDRVREGLEVSYAKYPFLAYGTDWLAFAHLVIAVAFWGPWKDPVRNVWVIEFAMIACLMVVPLALICGPIREIPFFWRIIDCSFGVFGVVPLWLVRRTTLRLEDLEQAA